MNVTQGDKVKKRSRKPFKNGSKINTMKGWTINPNTGLAALTFIEDDSVVDFKQLEKVDMAKTVSNRCEFSIKELLYIRGMNAALRYVESGGDWNYTIPKPKSAFGKGFNDNVRSYVKELTSN